MSGKPLISIVTPCYNEEENIKELYRRIKAAIVELESRYDFEIIVIDNHSTDSTEAKLREIAAQDKTFKVILNARNFGHIRSPYYGVLQSRGVATVYLASDLQDPPEMIPEFIRHWELGFKLVLAVKPSSEGNSAFHWLRRSYYQLLDSMSEVAIVKDATGFGLFDRVVLDHIRQIDDPYPFFRGLLAELGYPVKTITFVQPRRMRGISKNNIYTLYDMAWLGMVGHSKVPLRIAAFVGFVIGGLSLFAAFAYLVMKLIFWNSFPLGIAPLVIGGFFLFGVQLIFISILGEYTGTILTYVQRRPIVVEMKRINFDD
ncbi:glycosyltransferase family 2 protein [Roseixanthobacter liquoris]|uniref:glycosyltransferase family 2 protein n=1 Tax=Roseixanthobacter liquoris TaxID=3119921 RepID=UPI003727791E